MVLAMSAWYAQEVYPPREPTGMSWLDGTNNWGKIKAGPPRDHERRRGTATFSDIRFGDIGQRFRTPHRLPESRPALAPGRHPGRAHLPRENVANGCGSGNCVATGFAGRARHTARATAMAGAPDHCKASTTQIQEHKAEQLQFPNKTQHPPPLGCISIASCLPSSLARRFAASSSCAAAAAAQHWPLLRRTLLPSTPSAGPPGPGFHFVGPLAAVTPRWCYLMPEAAAVDPPDLPGTAWVASFDSIVGSLLRRLHLLSPRSTTSSPTASIASDRSRSKTTPHAWSLLTGGFAVLRPAKTPPSAPTS